MRVLDRLTAVAVALAFVLIGVGTPVHGATMLPAAVVTAAQRTIVHVAPPVEASLTTAGRAVPPARDARALVDRLGHRDASPDARAQVLGGPRGDDRIAVGLTDRPDDLLLDVPVRVGGTPTVAIASTSYRQPAAPLPPRGTLPTRAPPAVRR